MLRKLLLISVLALMSCSGEDGDLGPQGEQGLQGEQGVNEPVIESFAIISEDFEDNDNALNVVRVNNTNTSWRIEDVALPVSNIDRALNINNSSFPGNRLNSDGGGISSQTTFTERSSAYVSGPSAVNFDNESFLTINLGRTNENRVLLFDAYVSSTEFFTWQLNNQRTEGITGTTIDQFGNPTFAGPFKVAIELEPGIDNILTLIHTRNRFNSSSTLNAVAIDNVQIVDVTAYLEALEDFRDLNNQ